MKNYYYIVFSDDKVNKAFIESAAKKDTVEKRVKKFINKGFNEYAYAYNSGLTKINIYNESEYKKFIDQKYFNKK